ncbi:LrgB family protein [Pseudoalteromonas sp. SR41-1]|uniref:LrgB family protein n=1 Tax=Pseudoalteromonas sp. SR41-1 TaxID=2760952 RepID=UPI0015FF9B61|nr:LrgB family protein [Pseudoalteromonas sp. SR41-1]MBB1279359.1 LrgB family protein [Pseudoalteromonas sp. SR41-1]
MTNFTFSDISELQPNLWWLSIPFIIVLFLALRAVNQSIKSSVFKSLTNPVFLSISIIALLLVNLNLPYTQFATHSKLLSWLLEPAIVALALPLYQQFTHVRKNLLLIVATCSLGIVNATVVAFLLSILFNAPAQLSASVAALSVTTPISLIVTDSLGGISSLAAALVIFIGLLGALFGFMLFKLINIFNHESQGVAMGTACHAIGTAAAIAEHPKVGAYSSVAMALSALLTAIIVPLLYPFLVNILL